jgi:hypothetical protein
MESYAKYADMPRVHTCLLIDEPPVVLLGRTFPELVAAIAAFVGLAYMRETLMATVAALVVGWLFPLLRIRFPRGFILHVLWSFGLCFPKEQEVFTPRHATRHYGP